MTTSSRAGTAITDAAGHLPVFFGSVVVAVPLLCLLWLATPPPSSQLVRSNAVPRLQARWQASSPPPRRLSAATCPLRHIRKSSISVAVPWDAFAPPSRRLFAATQPCGRPCRAPIAAAVPKPSSAVVGRTPPLPALPAIRPRRHPLASVPRPQPRPGLRHSFCHGRHVVLVRICRPRFPSPAFGQGVVPSRWSRAVIAAAVSPRRSSAATSIHSRPSEAMIPAAVSWPRPLPATHPRRHAKCGKELLQRHLSVTP